MQIQSSFAEPYDEQQLAHIESTHGVSLLLARALWRRGLRDDGAIAAFLQPAAEPLPDPYALFDMDAAVACIRDAIEKRARICVFGDYDCDGVTATAILVRSLRHCGADVAAHIPKRVGEGYGMRMEAVEALYRDGVRLIVTVDNGVSAHAEVARCHALGMRVVITDHHRTHATLPEADAVVYSSRAEQPESVRGLCGAGVALLLSMALGTATDDDLAFAALATVADVVPLVGTNRTLVARGLPLVQRQPALLQLLVTAGADKQPVTETTLAFVLAPRLNAAGRMGDAARAFELLVTEDSVRRDALAQELERANTDRREEEQRIFEAALAMVPSGAQPRVLLLSGKDWNVGVIGIVASRLVERFNCPVLLFSEADGELVGSGRSVPAVDLFALLSAHSTLFSRFGGHALAAGVTMAASSFDALFRALDASILEAFPNGLPPRIVTYEETLLTSECTVALCDALQRLAPFGEGNPPPQFRLEGTLSEVCTMGKERQHLSAVLSDGTGSLRLAAFRRGEQCDALKLTDRVEMVGTLHKNVFQNRTSCNAYPIYLGAPRSPAVQRYADASLRALEGGAPLSDETMDGLIEAADAHPTEATLRERFCTLRPLLKKGLPLWALSEDALVDLLIFLEMGLVSVQMGQATEKTCTEKKQISDSRLYLRCEMLYNKKTF